MPPIEGSSWAERMNRRYERDVAQGGPVDILAIESSCDETAAAVVRNGQDVLSSVVYSQVASHSRFGGVVPEVAARAHVERVTIVVDEALRRSGRPLDSLHAVAVTHAPGLIGALFVGVVAAKSLAQAIDLPIIGVHHLVGHVYAAAVSHKVEPPFLGLIVSGGHTELWHVKDHREIMRLGKTRDDAAGEAFDKVARLLGLGYPGGPAIDALAQTGTGDSIEFPRAKLDPGSLDFSFSGLKSAVLQYAEREKRAGRELRLADVAASFQEAVVDALAERVEMALQQTELRTLVLAGGVAANRRLRDRLAEAAGRVGARLVAPDLWLCTDNAAMIGAAAFYRYRQGLLDDLSLTPQATLSVEQWLRGS